MAESGMQRVSGKSIGEILVDHGIVTQEQLETALAHGRAHGKRLGEALVDLGLISGDHVLWALGAQYGVQQVEILPDMIVPELVRTFPISVLREHCLLPLIEIDDELVVLTADPLATDGVEALRRLRPHRKITLQLANRAQIEQALDMIAPRPAPGGPPAAQDLTPWLEAGPPAVAGSMNMVRWLLAQTIAAGGELIVSRETAGRARARCVSGGASRVLGEFDAASFDALRELIQSAAVETAPAMPRQWVWPGLVMCSGRHYAIAVSFLHSLSASLIRLRPLRSPASADEPLDEYALPDEAARVVQAAAERSSAGVTVLVVEGAAQGDAVLFQYLGALGARMGHALFINTTARFAAPGAFQYSGEGELSSRFLASLVAATGAGHVVFDGPATLDDYLTIQAAGGRPVGMTATYRLAPGAGGRWQAPASLRQLLEYNPQATVVRASAAGCELLSAAEALESLAERR